MRILMIGGHAASFHMFRGSLITEMVRLGHEVLAAAGDMDADIERRIRALGARPISVELYRTGVNPWADAASMWGLYRLMCRERPDLVLAYTIKPSIYGMLAARLAGIGPRFAMITGLGNGLGVGGSIRHRLVARVVRSLCRIAMIGCRGILFQNLDDRNYFVDARLVGPSVPTHVVDGSGIDVEQFKPTALPTTPVFLMVARLLVEKGVHQYVEAARQLRGRHPSATWKLVGWTDGIGNAIKAEELTGWIDEGVIEYMGRLDDVRSAIASCSVFVLPSYYPEGLPRACLEAMAMGRAVITTDLPGCRETVIEGVNGKLVQPRSVQSLACAMEAFIHDSALASRMGDASRTLAVKRFDVRRVNSQMLKAMGLTG